MSKFKAWLHAARLRTLPLSISGILMGSALAALHGYTNTAILVLALFTTVGLQITSNFANDYGDGVKGTDNADRIGPERALQSGRLSRKELKKGIWVTIFIDVFLISCLLYIAFDYRQYGYILFFALLGLLSIWAAIRYTIGTGAYGYRGLGDLFVFCFFGLLAVLGSMFLYTKFITIDALLPAVSIGLLSTGVLNLNNLRDYKTDKDVQKNTLVVQMGFERGKKYQYALLTGAFICMLLFTLTHYINWKDAFYMLAFLPVLLHLRKVLAIKNPARFDPELKKLALSTFFLSLLCFLAFNYFL